MTSMNLRLKLRKNQSTVPSEKLTEDLNGIEILGDSVQKIPSLSHLTNCHYLMIHCPELTELPALPSGLEILKIRGGHFELQVDLLSHLTKCRILSIVQTKGINQEFILPATVQTLDLSGNGMESLPHSLMGLKSINRLTLDQNKLVNLPQELYALKTLNHLSLDNNPLSDETKNDLHKNFGLWF